MSVVAWDGRLLAADRQATGSGMRMVCTKLVATDDFVYAVTGDAGHIRALVDWHENKGVWPAFQLTPDWSRLVVLDRKTRQLRFFEQNPWSIDVQQTLWASGSGRDFAVGAMLAGADARQAVLLTNTVSVECGFGADVFDSVTGELTRHA